MSGLFHSLRMGQASLSAFQTAISVVSENISNLTTPGYSRKRVVFGSTTPQVYPYGMVGSGVEISRIESVRDRFAEQRLLNELQLMGSLEGQTYTLDQIETILFASEGAGVGEHISSFFNAFTELAADASSIEKRGVVMAEGDNLASTIVNTARRLKELQADARAQINEAVETVNSLLGRIASLNSQISSLASSTDGGSLRDERQLMMNELAGLIGLDSREDNAGVQTITTSSGRLLLMGDRTFDLQATETAGGTTLTLSGVDITAETTLGKLGGYLRLDSQIIPDQLSDLNNLAEEFANQVNLVHSGGQGLDGSTGLDFFNFTPGDAASTLTMALTDEESVAAGLPGGGAGDGTVAQQIADLRDLAVSGLGDQTFVSFFSQMVFEAGLEAGHVSANLDAQQLIVLELQNQRDSVSGVSLDEEQIHLIELERAYQASANYIQLVDSLLEETMNLLR